MRDSHNSPYDPLAVFRFVLVSYAWSSPSMFIGNGGNDCFGRNISSILSRALISCACCSGDVSLSAPNSTQREISFLLRLGQNGKSSHCAYVAKGRLGPLLAISEI